ncbi:hypothetical protein RZS28_02970 [Methylocapsa polymorpha]|uniref:Uncharacterized protein n=1 Tax=Methylocapsa polymorpha TaxID=3080828 RepID=A0ABZ0HUP7_9HYPH|nr:hypothetical protein RZS28_02970 [Methylocapsa sp. RX1]
MTRCSHKALAGAQRQRERFGIDWRRQVTTIRAVGDAVAVSGENVAQHPPEAIMKRAEFRPLPLPAMSGPTQCVKISPIGSPLAQCAAAPYVSRSPWGAAGDGG